MLIVLTSEQEIESEATLINQLFRNDLEVLHLRKPSFDIGDYRSLLNQIDDEFYSRIVIHQCHNLCDEFNLKGIHIQEQKRLDLGNELKKYVNSYRNTTKNGRSYSVSSSFHSKDEIQDCKVNFDYVLLSPVFNSISKAGYKGKRFDVSDINADVIGMGGINKHTIREAFSLGFKGVGVLGGVWNTKNPIESFKEMLVVGSEKKITSYELRIMILDLRLHNSTLVY